MKKLLLSIFIITGLSACGDSNNDDIKQWMSEEGKKVQGKIESLPPAKNFTPVPYNAVIDPFVVKSKINLADLTKDKFAPDLNRQKEALETEFIESLRMVGTIIKDGKFYAMIKDKNKLVHYVSVGNHIGTNYGEIKTINEGEMVLEERSKESDEWKLKTVRIYLYEGK